MGVTGSVSFLTSNCVDHLLEHYQNDSRPHVQSKITDTISLSQSFPKRQESNGSFSNTPLGKSRSIVQNFCTPDQMKIEKEAWDDAETLANHLDTLNPTGKGQAAVNLYFGTNSAKSYPYGNLWEQIEGLLGLIRRSQIFFVFDFID